MAKRTVEETYFIDVTFLVHQVPDGWEGIFLPLYWGERGSDLISADALYRFEHDDNGHQYLDIYMTTYDLNFNNSFRQRIALEQSSIPNGATRWWFRCPKCAAKRSKLYLTLDKDRFLCRVCNNLTYRSCQESRKWGNFYQYVADNLGQELSIVKKTLNSMVL